MTEIIVTIMAGGKGERFWPYSRTDMPKQFLRVFGKKTLLQQSVDRALQLATPENIYVVTDRAFKDIVAEQVPKIPQNNILIEPMGRDTAPCLALAAVHAQAIYQDSLMVVLPADHLILDVDKFSNTIKFATKAASTMEGIFTIGIQPTRPETGYGYIKRGADDKLAEDKFAVYKVDQFTEKPDIHHAMQYLQSGDYLWNSGMFIWKTATIMQSLKEHCPEIYNGIIKLSPYVGKKSYHMVINEVYQALPKISIDYAVLEKDHQVHVVPGEFGWDDLGNWTSLERVSTPDASGNLIQGTAVTKDTSNSIICNQMDDKLVVTLGLDNTLVVETDDVLLVADKDRNQDIKAIIKEIQEHGLERYLTTMGKDKKAQQSINDLPWDSYIKDKPWGREIWWSVTDQYVGKVLYVKADQCLSKQYHQVKRETMVFTSGSGIIEINEDKLPIKPGLVVDIPPGTIHRVEAYTDVTILEVSTPELDDVVRLEDRYGRDKKLNSSVG